MGEPVFPSVFVPHSDSIPWITQVTTSHASFWVPKDMQKKMLANTLRQEADSVSVSASYTGGSVVPNKAKDSTEGQVRTRLLMGWCEPTHCGSSFGISRYLPLPAHMAVLSVGWPALPEQLSRAPSTSHCRPALPEQLSRAPSTSANASAAPSRAFRSQPSWIRPPFR